LRIPKENNVVWWKKARLLGVLAIYKQALAQKLIQTFFIGPSRIGCGGYRPAHNDIITAKGSCLRRGSKPLLVICLAVCKPYSRSYGNEVSAQGSLDYGDF
jgi:hypothetical protein